MADPGAGSGPVLPPGVSDTTDVSDLTALLHQAADVAARYRATLPDRPVRAERSVDDVAQALGGAIPAQGAASSDVIAQLAAAADGGLTATVGPRYFGFVIGGALP